MTKQQAQKLISTKLYQNQLGKLFAFKNTRARYRKHYLPWDNIERANKKIDAVRKKSSLISGPANRLLSAVMGKLIKVERVLLNHKYISTFTSCERRQNQRIINELKDVLNITYHNSITVDGKKYRHCYEFCYKEQYQENIKSVEDSVGTFLSQQNDSHYIYKKNNNTESIRSYAHTRKSNFLQNSKSIKFKENTESKISEFPKDSAKRANLKKRLPNEQKKPANAKHKARVYHFNQYKEPQDLKHHYPLTKEDCSKLQSLSGRDFSLNAINEILLDMSKRLDNRFYSKAQFMVYFAKCLRFEMRDVVKTGNDFYIKANITLTKQREIDKEKQIEQYLSEVESRAIIHVCPENQLKARLANTLKPLRNYELLLNIKGFEVVGNTIRIYLRRIVQLSENEKNIVLSQVKSIYSTCIENVEYVVENICNSTNRHNLFQTKGIADIQTLQRNVWGDICQKLIDIYDQYAYKNWFSKLTPAIDENAKTIELKAPNSFIHQEVTKRYGDAIKKVANEFSMKFKGIIRTT